MSIFRFFSFLANVFLIIDSGKTAKRKEVSSDDFFALSAYSFKTAVTHQTDAYTILCLSDGIANSQDTSAGADCQGSEHSKVEHRHGKSYLLWELSF